MLHLQQITQENKEPKTLKMNKLTKLPLALRRKIDYINSVSKQIKNLDDPVYTYDGGTFPYCIDIDDIDVTENFVYIWVNKNDTYISRSNVTYQRLKIDTSNDIFANEELKHTLNVIAREYKKALK